MTPAARALRLFLPLTALSCACAQDRYQPVPDPQSPPGIPYTRYFTRDSFDRRITFYISGNQGQRLPLVVSILGSGAFSNFIRRGDQILDAHRTAREAFAGKAHILIVEKPGVAFLEQHPNRGTATNGSVEFRREHTLERWSEAVSAALRAAHALPLSDPRLCLLIGHSEGGIVAARVAAENPFVTHVATLAGGGPTQLFDLLESARAGRVYGPDLDPEKQVEKMLADVAAIQSDPDNADRFFLGHPYRRWSSFWKSSTMDELAHTRARLFIAQGTADQNVSVTAFDVLYASLLAQGRDVTARRIAGADHGFGFASDPKRDGWTEIFQEVRNWFLESER